jgi:hypothetical protein
MRIEERTLINRRPEEVFAFFEDRRNDRQWMDTVVSSEWVDEGQETALGPASRTTTCVTGATRSSR